MYQQMLMVFDAPAQQAIVMSVPETYLTVKEAAERLGVGDQRVRDLIKAGRLRAAWREDTRTWQVLEEDVINFRREVGGRGHKATRQE